MAGPISSMLYLMPKQQKRLQGESLLGLGLLILLDVDAEEAILQSVDEDDVMDVLLSGFLHGR